VKSYLLGSLRRAFLIYGQTGTGKTSFIGKIAMLASRFRLKIQGGAKNI